MNNSKKIAIAAVVAGVALASLCCVGGGVGLIWHKASGSISKAEQFEQRKAYDHWVAQQEIIRLSKENVALTPEGERKAKAKERLKKEEEELDRTVAECDRRWGKHPRLFADLPPQNDPYWQQP